MQDFAKNSSQVELAESSDLPFSWSQNTVPLSQDGSTIYIEGLVWALFVNIVKKILDEYTYTVSFYFEIKEFHHLGRDLTDDLSSGFHHLNLTETAPKVTDGL